MASQKINKIANLQQRLYKYVISLHLNLGMYNVGYADKAKYLRTLYNIMFYFFLRHPVYRQSSSRHQSLDARLVARVTGDANSLRTICEYLKTLYMDELHAPVMTPRQFVCARAYLTLSISFCHANRANSTLGGLPWDKDQRSGNLVIAAITLFTPAPTGRSYRVTGV